MSDRYTAAAHRMQSAIALHMTKRGLDSDGLLGHFLVGPRAENIPPVVGETLTHRLLIKELKDLRVGIDCASASQDGLARLLIEKDIFTLEEYTDAITVAMERESDLRCKSTIKALGLPEGTTFG